MISIEKIDLENIKIVSMVLEDINDVLEIQNESNLSKWTFLDYQNEFENKDSINLVAKLNKEIIGFAVTHLLLGSNKSEPIYSSSEIYNIAVKKSFQGLRIGQKILDKLLDELLKINVLEVWLEVRESNETAIKFYKRNGFVEEFIRKNYYNDPLENAYILKLVLNYEN